MVVCAIHRGAAVKEEGRRVELTRPASAVERRLAAWARGFDVGTRVEAL